MAGKEGIWEEEEEEGVVYRKGLLWLPADEALIRSIMKSDHDTRIAGYIGQDKTLELVRRNFRWAERMASMSEGQGGAPPTLRAAQPTRAPLHSVAVNCHERYRRPPVIRGMRPTLGGYRPIHQNGALPPSPERRQDGQWPRGNFAHEGIQGHKAATSSKRLERQSHGNSRNRLSLRGRLPKPNTSYTREAQRLVCLHRDVTGETAVPIIHCDSNGALRTIRSTVTGDKGNRKSQDVFREKPSQPEAALLLIKEAFQPAKAAHPSPR
jgi:hypothetical protein